MAATHNRLTTAHTHTQNVLEFIKNKINGKWFAYSCCMSYQATKSNTFLELPQNIVAAVELFCQFCVRMDRKSGGMALFRPTEKKLLVTCVIINCMICLLQMVCVRALKKWAGHNLLIAPTRKISIVFEFHDQKFFTSIFFAFSVIKIV